MALPLVTVVVGRSSFIIIIIVITMITIISIILINDPWPYHWLLWWSAGDTIIILVIIFIIIIIIIIFIIVILIIIIVIITIIVITITMIIIISIILIKMSFRKKEGNLCRVVTTGVSKETVEVNQSLSMKLTMIIITWVTLIKLMHCPLCPVYP